MSAISIWWKSKSPIFRFLSGFILLMLLFYIFYYSPLYEKWVMNPLLATQAYLANLFLTALHYGTYTVEDNIVGQNFRVSIKNGCDGMEATALYISAIIAFPFVGWKHKLPGLIYGVVVLSILNLFRIAGLYMAGIHWKSGFEFLHLHGGVIIFTLIAIVMWLIWLSRVRKHLLS